MDPDNAIMRICAQGVAAEIALRRDEAHALFLHAWRSSTDNVEACIAAHYVGRLQSDDQQALWWNQIALARADAVRDGRVRSFYASLHLNLGMAHEKLGQLAHARHHFQRAAASVADIIDDGHRVLVEYGINRGLERTRTAGS
ncbi:MAG: hypothetical protein H6Q90_5531 [Deltaproteobacteria bacterium]|nr:hypothetical protein [Deltaproteobacteria bacterium]